MHLLEPHCRSDLGILGWGLGICIKSKYFLWPREVVIPEASPGARAVPCMHL